MLPSHIDSRARSQQNQTARRARDLAKTTARVQRTATTEQRAALAQARVVRDRQLAAIAAELKPQIERLQLEMRSRRQAAWDAYDEKVSLVRQATILEPKA